MRRICAGHRKAGKGQSSGSGDEKHVKAAMAGVCAGGGGVVDEEGREEEELRGKAAREMVALEEAVPLRLEQEMVRRGREEEKFVYPWVAVIVNLDASRRQVSGELLALLQAKVKRLLSAFCLKDVKVFEAQHGAGVAAVMFERDLDGFCDAQALEMRFWHSGRGRKEWERVRQGHGNPGKDLYGWIARREDYYADNPLGKFLFDYGELKSVAMVGEEKMMKHSQRFQHTVDTTVEKYKHQVQRLESEVVAKNKELEAFDRRVEGLRNAVVTVEKARKKMEDDQLQAHRSEVESLNAEIKKMQEEQNNAKLDKANLLKGFEKRCLEMEQAKEGESEAERKKHENGRRELQRRLHMLAETHKKSYSDLIRKQERELKVVQEQQKKKVWEANQQKAELEKLRLVVKKHKIEEKEQRCENEGKFCQGKESCKPSAADKQSVDAPPSVKREVNESGSPDTLFLQDKLNEVSEEKEGLHMMVNCLLRKERELNEELEQTRRTAVEILEKHGSRERIGVKRMGEIDNAPWKVACKRKYKDEWETHFMRITSEWEQLVRNSEWQPFKVVPVGDEDEWKEVIDQDDKKLQLLRRELGKAVCKTVTNALSEIEEFNASGRYPVPVAFNFEEYRRANLKEVLKYLEEIIENGKIAKRRKRHRQE